jgi:hypothetical protein
MASANTVQMLQVSTAILDVASKISDQANIHTADPVQGFRKAKGASAKPNKRGRELCI